MLQHVRQLEIAVGIVLVNIRDGQTAASGGRRVVLLGLTLQNIALKPLDGQPYLLQRIALLRKEHGGRAQQLLARQMRGHQDLQPEYALEEVRLSVERLEGYILQCQAQRNDTPAARCGRMAVEYIGAHYADCDLKLPDLLEHLGVSRSYFSTVFKEKTGQSFVEYLTNLRMEKAKEYLRETGLCTYEIADRIGFADPHYFSLTFRRRTGMTPKQYREAEK